MKLFRSAILLFISIISFLSVSAQTVDTILVYSNRMEIDVKNVIILPEDYTTEKNYSVLYLLHGYGGNHTSWLYIKPDLPKIANKLNLIIVCPDGKNSWYWDSPINPKSQYETYVSQELVNYIDTNYSTIQSPSGRAITGLSMGGHGGLWLGIRHQDVFGACGSMSGGVDIRPFPNNWDMMKALGTYKESQSIWAEHTVINQIQKVNRDSLSIIVDCGVDDFFYEVNESLHRKLLEKKIPHDYIIRPGKHNVAYWRNAIDYQLLYFGEFFEKRDIK